MLNILDIGAESNFFEQAKELEKYLNESGTLDQHYTWWLEGVKYNEYTDYGPCIVFKWVGDSICCGTEEDYVVIRYGEFFDGNYARLMQYSRPLNRAKQNPEIEKLISWF